ncbi:hypothetical protein U6G28_08715 [Actinomycetaceae bacterium MB13-C1-2]|nr:hypothetical protein U6G28_08715 [Actinomycetaceae bacterium MB13-C1-2]
MPDPVDWGLVLESPVFWGAVMTLVGVLVGKWEERRSKKDDLDLDRVKAEQDDRYEALKLTVETLKGEYARLIEEVKILRLELDEERKGSRMMKEKYSASLAYIVSLWTAAVGLFSRLDATGVDHGEIPKPPDLIAVDIQPLPDTE